MLEINSLAKLIDGRALVGNSKVGLDDAAEFHQEAIHAGKDAPQEDHIEVEAKRPDLNYIKLDGFVAGMVNGLGLATAAMGLRAAAGASRPTSWTSMALP